MTRRNWAGNLAYRADRLHRPATRDELSQVMASTRELRVLGSRHSFNDIADGAEQVSLEALPERIDVDRDAGTVTCSAWITYGRLAQALGEHGLALANLASLPHISIAGAIATATHGSGDGNGNLATSVLALELVSSAGEIVTWRRGDADFDGVVVGLGALGAVLSVTLAVEPSYDVTQHAYEHMPWRVLLEHFDAIMASGYSVSVFSRWGESVEQVWVKTRVGSGPQAPPDALFGARAATSDRHPIVGLDPVHATPQLGVPGRWSDRLPHFRMGFTPSNGDELQSEYLMPRRYATDAIDALLSLSRAISPLIQVAEIRTIAADGLWMSPAYHADLVAFHSTWVPDVAAVAEALERIENVLAPFEARPHWGKLFRMRGDAVMASYPRAGDFRALRARCDPRDALRNAWLTRVLGG